MLVIKEGAGVPPEWTKTVACSTRDISGRDCGAVFVITKRDCVSSCFGNQDDRADEYTYHCVCPTCQEKIHVSDLDYIQKWR